MLHVSYETEMAIETELKLRISPEHLARLKRHALFRTHQITAPQTRRLYNVYYDTPELELHKRRMALRLRRAGGRWIQTLKGGGQMRAGLHQRFEWEVPVPTAELDFSGLDEAVWDEHLPAALRESLQPVFITDFYRTSRQLAWNGAIIEVCMDKGEVKTADQSTPLCELELELKSGEPAQLFDLALTILEFTPFELETVSKAEQGFNLMAGIKASPFKMPDVSASENVTQDLQALIWSCVHHMQKNLTGAMSGEDAEYLHQLRIALRRLRVVLGMVCSILADQELTVLREELAHVAGEFGKIREWDVFIAQIEEHRLALPDIAQRRRADSYASLRGRASEFQSLLLRLSVWMNGPYWQQAEKLAPKMNKFSKNCLQKRYREYAKSAEDIGNPDALHALRIKAKKLRYSAEFLASLYDKSAAKSFLSALGEIQELSGQINDISVANGLLDELYVQNDAVTTLKREINSPVDLKLKQLKRRIKRFDQETRFWE